jgi:2-dehydropantoate 2-reductase
MRIAVVGGGAIGSYYAALLTRSGHDVRLLTRGAHLDVLRARGLLLRTTTGEESISMRVTDSPRELQGSEYAIVAVKSYSLPDVSPVLVGLSLDGAAIVPLLNGVDIDDRLVALGVTRSGVLPGLTVVSVVRTAAGVVEQRSTYQRVVVGERSGEMSARARALVDALQGAGFEARVSTDIRLDLWRKFVFLASMAAACGLLRRPIGDVRATPEGRDLLAGAVHEIIEVGRAVGVAWADDDEASTRAALDALTPGIKPSFLLDVERGGPTELDVLSGTVSRLGHEHGIATPVHDKVLRFLLPTGNALSQVPTPR